MTHLLPVDHHKVVEIRKINKDQTAKALGSVSQIDSSHVSDNDDDLLYFFHLPMEPILTAYSTASCPALPL